MKYTDPNYILVTGFAQLPKGTPLFETQKIFGCSLVMDRTDDRVVDASFTFLMDVTRDFIRELVIGRRLPDEWESLQQAIQEQFFVHTPGAVIQAIRIAIERYIEAKSK
ncbi:DUF3870 domain-containing protein [Aneurinibacillus sp. BA2021]|nr:DUF3870 domain-containing protein [Aneurinibacillus sp. BA2021]